MADTTEKPQGSTTDLGDLVVILLAGTLSGLRDRLHDDGFEAAASLVAELNDKCDDYIEGVR